MKDASITVISNANFVFELKPIENKTSYILIKSIKFSCLEGMSNEELLGKMSFDNASKMVLLAQDEDTKKSLEKQYNLLDRATKDRVFEGITFDYDFVMNNISSKLDLDLYLTNLSQRTMYKLEQTYSYAPQTNWLKPLLENKKIHLNIDENKNVVLYNI